ncbi:MAG: hypothetical protein WEC99_08720 [Halofilum sp. (in: g-proteobacteria)]
MDKPEGIEEAPVVNYADLHRLLQADEGPCISIYSTTSPETNWKDKNRILYKDRVKEAGAALEAREMDKHVRSQLIEQLERVGESDHFWFHQQHGLAVFLSPQRCIVRKLMRSPGDLTVVADSFHLRPLLHVTQHGMCYQVLCVSAHDVALYEADQEQTCPVELHSHVPTRMVEATGKPANAPNRKDNERAADDSKELHQFFTRLDSAVYEHHNGPAQVPLLLATQSQYQGLFREASKNPNLLDVGFERDPFHELEQDQLGELTWNVVQDALAANLDELVERYHSNAAHELAFSEVDTIARAATMAQVETLLVEEDRRIGGRLSQEGEVEYGDFDAPRTDDVIDDIAERVLRAEGQVRFLPREKMPVDTGVAAILRFAMKPDEAVI